MARMLQPPLRIDLRNTPGAAMASILDVAAYILTKLGNVSAMKLQKLTYYSQAWSLVWDERPLFDDHFQAWANGPVSPALYARHRGKFMVESGTIPGDATKLDDLARETIDLVIEFYGNKSPGFLSDLTHRERPWVEARTGIPVGERGSREITHEAMADYYGSLV